MSTIIIIRKPPAEQPQLTVVPADDNGFLIQDENGETVGTALDQEQAQAYVDLLNAGG